MHGDSILTAPTLLQSKAFAPIIPAQPFQPFDTVVADAPAKFHTVAEFIVPIVDLLILVSWITFPRRLLAMFSSDPSCCISNDLVSRAFATGLITPLTQRCETRNFTSSVGHVRHPGESDAPHIGSYMDFSRRQGSAVNGQGVVLHFLRPFY